jgi:hypothetical protein
MTVKNKRAKASGAASSPTAPPARAGSCEAKTKDGGPCRASPLPGRRWCFNHDPARAKAQAVARRRGGEATRAKMARRTVADNGAALALGSNRDLVAFLGIVIHEVRTGKLDAKIGGVLGNLANVLARVLSNVEVVQRVEAIEAAVAALTPEQAEGVRGDLAAVKSASEARQ